MELARTFIAGLAIGGGIGSILGFTLAALMAAAAPKSREERRREDDEQAAALSRSVGYEEHA